MLCPFLKLVNLLDLPGTMSASTFDLKSFTATASTILSGCKFQVFVGKNFPLKLQFLQYSFTIWCVCNLPTASLPMFIPKCIFSNPLDILYNWIKYPLPFLLNSRFMYPNYSLASPSFLISLTLNPSTEPQAYSLLRRDIILNNFEIHFIHKTI